MIDGLEEKIRELAEGLFREFKKLGKRGRKIEKTEDEKKIIRAEAAMFEVAKKWAEFTFEREYQVFAEDFKDVIAGIPKVTITVDPVDGTLYYARQKTESTFPYTTAVAVLEGDRIKDTVAALVVDLQTKEYFYAVHDKHSRSVSTKKDKEIQAGGNEEHDPLWISDFGFKINAKLRDLFSNPKNGKSFFEFMNAGSNTWHGIRVACGEADCYVNMGGPKGYEIAAMYRLIKNAGGYGLCLETGKDIGDLVFEAKKKYPVVFAKDEELAKHVYETIKKGL